MTINEIKNAITVAGNKLTAEFKIQLAGNPNLDAALGKIESTVSLMQAGVDKKYYAVGNKTSFNVCNLVAMDGFKGDRHFAAAIIERL